MSESEHKMIEILRILNEQKKPTGSKFIAEELESKGFNLGERAVRYHMQMLDQKGYTKRKGYSGRIITDLGREMIGKGLVYDQVDFIHSKFEEIIYSTSFDSETKKGRVVVNTSQVYDKKALNTMEEVFKKGLSVSSYIQVEKMANTKNAYQVQTICGTTIDGILLSNGILSQLTYGGLLKIKDYSPKKFTELISYKKTSITPLDAFVAKGMTSVLDVINEGNGLIPANFRVIPATAKSKTKKIIDNLEKVGISGVIAMGEERENVLGIPVPAGMIGICVIGGITPFCAAQEEGYEIDIQIGENLTKFENLKPITKTHNKFLRPYDHKYHLKIPFILSKSWNLIDSVTFDIEKEKGKIVSNTSYINKEDLDDSLKIMKKTYKSNKKYLNPYYYLQKHPSDDSKIGISTICSLSIDGILIKNKMMCNPKYGGLLELTKNPLFIELISYDGSSLDPHTIFISKGMTSVTSTKSINTILASIKEIPNICRKEAEFTLNKLKDIGFSVYKIGKPREIIYNAKVDSYNFGVVTGSGLNLIAAIKEKGINVDVKAVSNLIPFEEMEKI